MIEKECHIALPQTEAVRFQEYGIGIFSSISTKSGLKKIIKKGLITIDGLMASTATYIRGGETIILHSSAEPNEKARIELKLHLFYEDDHLAIVNKPAGILVSGNKSKTVVNALAYNLRESLLEDALINPLPVHRLDFPTSGLLIVAKSNSALVSLNKMFENKEISKTYHAITIGKMKGKGVINFDIDNKKALTQYEVLRTLTSVKYGFLNLVRLFPATGRRHQLRIHLAEIGNQILGDDSYGKEELILTGKGLYLHASGLEFKHPASNEIIKINQELPAKFIKIFN